MLEDKELIRQYATEQSDAAFAELVRRHLNMVYAAALRQVNGDSHLAEDLAQTVFAHLAAKAASLQGATSIAGWLYTNTRFAAVKAIRAENRRRAREQIVVTMNEINAHSPAGWNELRPLIDDALSELAETDREAIVLRFFESYEFALVGAALGVSENAARMRVERALEKLRAVLQKRGLATTASALAGVLAEAPATAVTAQLAAGITRVALSRAALVPSHSTIVKIIAMKKTSLMTAGALALVLTTVLVARKQTVSDSHLQTFSPSSPASAAPAGAGPGDGSAPTPDAKPDPDPFKKIIARHDEQVRARGNDPDAEARARWEKKVADFDNSMQPEPGIKKFGRKIQTTLLAGQSLMTGGWEISPGKTLFIMARPHLESPAAGGSDPSAGKLNTSFPMMTTAQPSPDPQNQGVLGKITDEEASNSLTAITNQPGSELISTPNIIQEMGREASISVVDVEVIAGKQQHLGLEISYFPKLNADGTSLDVGMLVHYTVPDRPSAAPAGGK